MNKKLKITQIKSTIKRTGNQKRIIKALGLKKRGRSVFHNNTAPLRGMVNAVSHLVKVEEIDGDLK